MSSLVEDEVVDHQTLYELLAFHATLAIDRLRFPLRKQTIGTGSALLALSEVELLASCSPARVLLHAFFPWGLNLKVETPIMSFSIGEDGYDLTCQWGFIYCEVPV